MSSSKSRKSILNINSRSLATESYRPEITSPSDNKLSAISETDSPASPKRHAIAPPTSRPTSPQDRIDPASPSFEPSSHSSPIGSPESISNLSLASPSSLPRPKPNSDRPDSADVKRSLSNDLNAAAAADDASTEIKDLPASELIDLTLTNYAKIHFKLPQASCFSFGPKPEPGELAHSLVCHACVRIRECLANAFGILCSMYFCSCGFACCVREREKE
jgi:hypothetical protein